MAKSYLMLPVAAAVFAGGCAMQSTVPQSISKGVVVENVTIVNTRDGSLRPRMALVLEEGRIVKIAAAGSFRAAGSAQAVDGSGKFAVPGFLDMHAHALESADRNPSYWPLMVANGITGFREMSGSAEMLERGSLLKRQVAEGAVVAPELLAQPGRLINNVPDGRRVVINTAALAVEEVRQQKGAGAGFIKLLNVSREVFFASVAEARAQGLGVVGHLTPVVSATEASNAGMRSMEHFGAGMINMLADCSTDEAAIRKAMSERFAAPRPKPAAPPTPALIQRLLANPVLGQLSEVDLVKRVFDTWSEEKCRALARTFVKNGTWQLPSLIRFRTMQIGNDPAYRTDPDLKYVAPATRNMWQDVAEDFTRRVPAASADTYRRFYDLQLRVVKLFSEEGVKMIAGPDMTGQWVIPGFGLHREFRELARAGLSPLQVLQMTTLNGAEFLGRAATMGTVDEGKNADLVLLEGNPVESVENLGRIWAVVLKGRVHSRPALEKMKDDVAAAYVSR